MSDIAERLKRAAPYCNPGQRELLEAAAKEIERLRREVDQLVKRRIEKQGY